MHGGLAELWIRDADQVQQVSIQMKLMGSHQIDDRDTELFVKQSRSLGDERPPVFRTSPSVKSQGLRGETMSNSNSQFSPDPSLR